MSNYRHGTNYYEILEVDRDAPQNEIHKAYQRAKATYSADNSALYSMFSKDEAKELARMIEEAYVVLGNQAQRKIYDQSLLEGPASNSEPVVQEPSPAPAPTRAPATSHEQLPDLNPSSIATPEGYFIRKEAPKPSLPKGTGRTGISTYKIDEGFEAEVEAVADWDGPWLNKVRTYKNISLEQVSDATRISRTYLQAVENDEFNKLPAPVFVRGFVIQIARVLELDPNKVAASYMKLYRAKTGK